MLTGSEFVFLNPFLTNVALIQEPGSWSPASLLKNVTLPEVFFKYFASKNQLPRFYISGAFVENGLTLS